MEQITKTEMQNYYEQGLLIQPINVGDKIISRLQETQDEPEKTVYCDL